MQNITLKDSLAQWPPTNSAAVDNSPSPEGRDLITQARVSSDGCLVLSLQRDNRYFCSSSPINKEHADILKSIVAHLRGKTLAQAGGMLLSQPSATQQEGSQQKN